MITLPIDFQFISTWEPNGDKPTWRNAKSNYGRHSWIRLEGYLDKPKYLIDVNTGKEYLNEPESLVRLKCAELAVLTPIVHTVIAVCSMAFKILRLVSLYHFWADTHQPLKNRVADAGDNLLRTVIALPGVVALELAALYGLFYSPYDGRKLYANLEREVFGKITIAPCFRIREERAPLQALCR
jgi:hypothetical protein